LLRGFFDLKTKAGTAGDKYFIGKNLTHSTVERAGSNLIDSGLILAVFLNAGQPENDGVPTEYMPTDVALAK
jgi:hypothetical protein